MLQFMGIFFMRLTREQKLEMVLKHLDDGISFAQLASEYQHRYTRLITVSFFVFLMTPVFRLSGVRILVLPP